MRSGFFVRASYSRGQAYPRSVFGALESIRAPGLVLRRLNEITKINLKGGIRFMPEVGDMAPDFELKSHLEKDKKVKLSNFRGQKNVVIAFYPLAWTPV
jgi:hypothetical protein